MNGLADFSAVITN